MEFLRSERAAVSRLVESHKKSSGKCHASRVQTVAQSDKKSMCLMPAHNASKHNTFACRDFKKLSQAERYKIVKDAHACFRCLGNHRRESCPSDKSCKNCGATNHNVLLCRKGQEEQKKCSTAKEKESTTKDKEPDSDTKEKKTPTPGSYHVKGRVERSLLPIQSAFVINSGNWARVFCDGGSNSSYITHKSASRLKAKRLNRYTLDVTTMGGTDTTYDTFLYELSLRTENGRVVPIKVFGMEKLTGPVSLLEEESLQSLFPDYDPTLLQRKSTEVDILLGSDYFGLHPKQEICSAGDNLSIMKGELGTCLQGYHPDLNENTELYATLVKEVHGADIKVTSNLAHCHFYQNPKESTCTFHQKSTHGDETSRSEKPPEGQRINAETMITKASCEKVTCFIEGEELGTEVLPRCGGCKCSKCPIVGHTYSFKEQQELNMIKENLSYDADQHCWITKYPWLLDPDKLPENYNTALATLKRTERTLSRDKEWAQLYSEQMEDLLIREVALPQIPLEKPR